MKSIILKKTLTERLSSTWKTREIELSNKYLDQLKGFLENHNNDIDAALASVMVMIRDRENKLERNTIFDRLIPTDKSEEIILRLFSGIFEAILCKKELEFSFI